MTIHRAAPCPTCGKTVALDKHGNIRWHRNTTEPRTSNAYLTQPCPGFRQPPAANGLDRLPLGLRFHFRSAGAACEGRAQFHTKHSQAADAAVWNALASLFYEAAERDDHDTPLGRALLESADALVPDHAPRHAPLTDESCGVIPTKAGRRLVDDYRAHRTQQHPKAATDA